MAGCKLGFNSKLVTYGDLVLLDLFLSKFKMSLCEFSVFVIVTQQDGCRTLFANRRS